MERLHTLHSGPFTFFVSHVGLAQNHPSSSAELAGQWCSQATDVVSTSLRRNWAWIRLHVSKIKNISKSSKSASLSPVFGFSPGSQAAQPLLAKQDFCKPLYVWQANSALSYILPWLILQCSPSCRRCLRSYTWYKLYQNLNSWACSFLKQELPSFPLYVVQLHLSWRKRLSIVWVLQ